MGSGVTHLLLATLVARTLDTWLALLVAVAMVAVLAVVGMVFVHEAAGAALDGSDAGAALALGAAVPVAGTGRAGRAHGGGPAGDDGGAVHAPRRFAAAGGLGRRWSAAGCLFVCVACRGPRGETKRGTGEPRWRGCRGGRSEAGRGKARQSEARRDEAERTASGGVTRMSKRTRAGKKRDGWLSPDTSSGRESDEGCWASDEVRLQGRERRRRARLRNRNAGPTGVRKTKTGLI